jgi:hypothetical protein
MHEAISKQTGCYLTHAGFLLGLFFDSEEAAGALLATCFTFICWLGLAYYSILKMETTYTSETSVDF